MNYSGRIHDHVNDLLSQESIEGLQFYNSRPIFFCLEPINSS